MCVLHHLAILGYLLEDSTDFVPPTLEEELALIIILEL